MPVAPLPPRCLTRRTADTRLRGAVPILHQHRTTICTGMGDVLRPRACAGLCGVDRYRTLRRYY